MTAAHHYREKAGKLFAALITLGCRSAEHCGCLYVHFDFGRHHPAIRLNAGETARFARLIRELSMLERTGAVIAETNRMNEVIGWHISGS